MEKKGRKIFSARLIFSPKKQSNYVVKPTGVTLFLQDRLKVDYLHGFHIYKQSGQPGTRIHLSENV